MLWDGNTLMNRTDIWSKGFCTVTHILPFDSNLVDRVTGSNVEDVINALEEFNELVTSHAFYAISLTDILYDALAITYSPDNVPLDRPVTTGVDYFALLWDFNDNEVYSGLSGMEGDLLDHLCTLSYNILNYLVLGLAVHLTQAERTVISDMVMSARDVFDMWGDSLLVTVDDEVISFMAAIPQTPDPSFEVDEFEVYSSYRSKIDMPMFDRGVSLQEAVRTI